MCITLCITIIIGFQPVDKLYTFSSVFVGDGDISDMVQNAVFYGPLLINTLTV